jgi:hypothetical protein
MEQYIWLSNCYQLRCDDDSRSGHLHGAHKPGADAFSNAVDFLAFCLLCARRGVLPSGWNWGTWKEGQGWTGGFLAAAFLFVGDTPAESGAEGGCGLELMFPWGEQGNRNLRNIAEQVYSCSTQEQTEPPDVAQAHADSAGWHGVTSVADAPACVTEVGGADAWAMFTMSLHRKRCDPDFESPSEADFEARAKAASSHGGGGGSGGGRAAPTTAPAARRKADDALRARECWACGQPKGRDQFSKTQWAKGDGGSRCTCCIKAGDVSKFGGAQREVAMPKKKSGGKKASRPARRSAPPRGSAAGMAMPASWSDGGDDPGIPGFVETTAQLCVELDAAVAEEFVGQLLAMAPSHSREWNVPGCCDVLGMIESRVAELRANQY